MKKPLINGQDDEEMRMDKVCLPGFRFHPTDEELVGFYLRKKVDHDLVGITTAIDQLIQHLHVYNYDPWDLPKCSWFVHNYGHKLERYYFCKRGRKYKNSTRPNRVSPSGFWKATGIDRPIYSSSSTTTAALLHRRQCIGLKKTLVFYRGIAGKGTKTQWMMHEFRLPPPTHDRPIQEEAEVWTICRIFERDAPLNKSGILRNDIINVKSSSNVVNFVFNHDHNSYISFPSPIVESREIEKKQHHAHQDDEIISASPEMDEFIVKYGGTCDELGPVVYSRTGLL